MASHDAVIVPFPRINGENEEDSRTSMKFTARASKKKRSGPSLDKLPDTLIEFPSLAAPLTGVLNDALQNGIMNTQNLADNVRKIVKDDNVYSPTDFSGLSLDVVVNDFQLLYNDNYLGEGKEYVWRTDQIIMGLLKEVLDIKPSHCFMELAKLAHKYMKRTSEVICRTMIDIVLLNVIDELVSAPYPNSLSPLSSC